MVITEQYLHNLGACQPGIDLWLTKKEADPIRCVDQLVKISKYTYATWLIAHLLTPKNAAKLAIYSAEQALPVFEARCPIDNRPRKAIQAAKKVLKNPTKENINAVHAAADLISTYSGGHAALSAKYAARCSGDYVAFSARHAALCSGDYVAALVSTYPGDYAALAIICTCEANFTDMERIICYGKTLLKKQIKEE
jgi:hypothetical protein